MLLTSSKIQKADTISKWYRFQSKQTTDDSNKKGTDTGTHNHTYTKDNTQHKSYGTHQYTIHLFILIWSGKNKRCIYLHSAWL